MLVWSKQIAGIARVSRNAAELLCGGNLRQLFLTIHESCAGSPFGWWLVGVVLKNTGVGKPCGETVNNSKGVEECGAWVGCGERDRRSEY